MALQLAGLAPWACEFPAHVDCDDHGSCGGGICSCSDGYSGARCSCDAACRKYQIAQVQSLLAFKASGNGQGLDGWRDGGDPCGDGGQAWFFLICRDGVVTGMHVHLKELTGDIGRLERLTQLTELSIGGTKVTGDVAQLTGLAKLTVLHVSHTGVSGDVGKLRALTQLTQLYTDYTGVTGDVGQLAALTQLTKLGLGSTGIDGDVSTLAALTQLTELGMRNTGVAGDVSTLASLTKLTILGLQSTGVTGCPLQLANGKSCHCPGRLTCN